MKFNALYRSLLLLAVVFILNGCMENLPPVEVSERFWTAVQNKDAGTVHKYISSEAHAQNDLTANLLPIDRFTLGKTIIDGEMAWVDTTVVISGDQPFTVPLKTVLLQENKQWKVDYDATVSSISGGNDLARLLGHLNDLGIQFSDQLNRSLVEMQKALPEVQKELEKLEENMKQKLPELQQQLEEFVRQLEEALGGKSDKHPPPGTKEI